MTSFLGLTGLAGSSRLFAPAYIPAEPPNDVVRYDLTPHGWSRSGSNLDHPLVCAVTDCPCRTMVPRFGRHTSVWLEGEGQWLSLDAPEGLRRFIACRTQNALPLWDDEHSSGSLWAKLLGWSYCATASDPPTTSITTPEIVVTLHDDVDHDDTEVDDPAYWLLSTEWGPRLKTLVPDAAEVGDFPSHDGQQEVDDRPAEGADCLAPAGASDSGYSSPAEAAEPTANALRDRQLNQKLADMISAIDWDDDE